MAPRTVTCATALFVTYRDRQRFGAMRACHHRGRGIAKKTPPLTRYPPACAGSAKFVESTCECPNGSAVAGLKFRPAVTDFGYLRPNGFPLRLP